MSIDSQLKEMGELAVREGLNVVEIKRESHSAKSSGTRPIFAELVEEIRGGKFDGVLTWAPDRLSRNAGDLGVLVDLMDRGALKEIRAHSQKFTNNPNEKFMLMILGSQAKLENDHRSINVRRGLKAKCERGTRPGVAPIGYLNQRSVERGQGKIIIDPVRAPVIKEMFTKVINEGISGRDLKRWLDKIGFGTKSGKRMTLSHVYSTLREPFYTGSFEYPVGSGQWYQGAYEPIIGKDLFMKAREIINGKLQAKETKPWSKEFDFTKLMICGSCGSGIGAQEKTKHQENGNVHHYVYYYCNRGRQPDCKELYVREEEIIKQLVDLIDDIDVEGFKARKRLTAELERFRRFTGKVLGNAADLVTPEEINVKNYAKYLLMEGSRSEKHDVLECLKGELVLKDKKLLVVKK